MQEVEETWVRSLGQENPLEEGMATHSSILSWRILWAEEPGRLQSWGHKSQTATKSPSPVPNENMEPFVQKLL